MSCFQTKRIYASLFDIFVMCTWIWTCYSQTHSTGSPNNKGFQCGCRPSNLWNIQQILQRALSEAQATRFRWVFLWSFDVMRISQIFFVHIFLTFVTVLGKIYELLGVLAEVHPSEMVNNSEKLYKAYLGELKDQVWKSWSVMLGWTGPASFKQTIWMCVYVFILDDFFNKGTKTFCCSWMFARNHSSDGQLHKNHGRRWDVVCVCVSMLLTFVSTVRLHD